MAEVDAWKQDAEGPYLEMIAGTRKDYSINATDFLESEDLAVPAVWTVPAGVTKVSQEQTTKIAKVVLLAGAAAGVFACDCKLSGNGVLIEIIRFRVIVEA